MKHDQLYHDFVLNDLLSGIPGVNSRSMFGGWGLYQDGVIFGIIVDGEFFLKADQDTLPQFESMGSRPFTYQRRGQGTGQKNVALSYWLLPAEVADDPDELQAWVARAVQVSRKKSRAVR